MMGSTLAGCACWSGVRDDHCHGSLTSGGPQSCGVFLPDLTTAKALPGLSRGANGLQGGGNGLEL